MNRYHPERFGAITIALRDEPVPVAGFGLGTIYFARRLNGRGVALLSRPDFTPKTCSALRGNGCDDPNDVRRFAASIFDLGAVKGQPLGKLWENSRDAYWFYTNFARPCSVEKSA